MGDDTTAARRVMVVADGSREAAGALQYALSHAVVDNDTLILLHVEHAAPPPKTGFGGLFKNPISPAAPRLGGPTSSGEGSVGGRSGRGGGGGEVDFLDGMKRACAAAKPMVKVSVEKAEVAEGKDKGAVIVAHSAATNVELLIIGQKRSAFSKSILGARRGLSLKGLADTAEYAVENSKCTCVAVQRKANGGGYLLNSKTHKNFWLLA